MFPPTASHRTVSAVRQPVRRCLLSSGQVLLWRLGCAPCRAQFEVSLLGQARGHLRRPLVAVSGGGGVSGLFEQVGPDRFETVGVRHPVVGLKGAEQGQPRSRSMDVRDGDGAAERDHWPGGDGAEDVVEREDLRPVICGRGAVSLPIS